MDKSMTAFPFSLSQPGVVDVIVVGAGLSGLRAAHLLQKAGLSTVVLEARDRVGGKTLTTDRVDGISFRQEYGAAWINDSTQSHIWELAQELGIQCLVQNSEGKGVAQDLDGSCVQFEYGEAPAYPSEFDTIQCLAVRDLIQKVTTQRDGPLQSPTERKELDSVTFETYLHRNTNGNARAYATAKVWSHALIGCDPGEVSALFILDYIRAGGGLMQMRSDKKHGGQHMRVKDGVSAFSERLVQRLIPGTLKLRSPVTGVTEIQELGCSLVTTVAAVGPRNYLGRRIIMTVPTPVYRTITFYPPLSPAKRAYVDATRYASYTKYLTVFKKCFWRENGYCGLAQSFVGPVCVFRDTSIEDGVGQCYCLTGFIAGCFARSWSALSPPERKRVVLKQISQIFNSGKDVTELFVEALESPWMSEQYSGWGCPIPILPPGVLDGCWDAFVSSEGNLHFIGNETSTIWRGYMDGAIRTAERGAAEVITALKREKAQL